MDGVLVYGSSWTVKPRSSAPFRGLAAERFRPALAGRVEQGQISSSSAPFTGLLGAGLQPRLKPNTEKSRERD
jgi:hypothetical protein